MNEITSYFILLAVGSIVVVINNRLLVYFLFLPVFVLFVIVSRGSGFDNDTIRYALWMEADFKGFYYWREFLYHEAIRNSYKIFGNAVDSFIALDFAALSLVMLGSIKIPKKNMPFYTCILFTSFPFLMAMQNFHRQYFMLIAVLIAYAAVRRRAFGIAILFFMVGTFFHNSAVLILPLAALVMIKDKVNTRTYLITLAAVAAINVVLLYMITTGSLDQLEKSDAATGLNMSIAYVFVFVIILSMMSYFRKSINEAIELVPSALGGILIVAPMAVLFNDAPAERVGMMFLLLCILDFCLIGRDIRGTKAERITFKVFFILFAVIPMFVFGNSKDYINTGSSAQFSTVPAPQYAKYYS